MPMTMPRVVSAERMTLRVRAPKARTKTRMKKFMSILLAGGSVDAAPTPTCRQLFRADQPDGFRLAGRLCHDLVGVRERPLNDDAVVNFDGPLGVAGHAGVVRH